MQIDVTGERAPAPPDWVPVERRFWGMDRATLVPAGLVAVLVAVAMWALPGINRSIEVEDPVRAGDVIRLEGVEFDPAAGWNIDQGLRASEPPVSGSFTKIAQVSSGAFSVTIVSDGFDGTPRQLLAQLQDNNDRLKQTVVIDTGRASTLTNLRGDRGAIARFTSAGTGGLIAAYVFDGTGVEIVVMGPDQGDDDQVESQIATMIRSVRPVTEGATS
ncbi:hypothetical protein EFK50_11615 [Nocardioides marmoriginsengisoli]|uniref:Uncharacterized protein n=1 Tax=Nocardioides marmoriginsengisoli TaxID=661483 RepID=A0A3N0CG51_9ACTN|nr:hypothetical protein [Nocardioides marmoriginsengisoli]RNL62415.1 hypothetical protein EFK50_11615 [Nocardioides marmoriginsengisoli]